MVFSEKKYGLFGIKNGVNFSSYFEIKMHVKIQKIAFTAIFLFKYDISGQNSNIFRRK